MKKVLVLFGGNSYEHEVSCKSANFIIDNIDKSIFEFDVVGIDFNNEWYEVDKKLKIDSNWKNNIIKKIDNINDFLKKFDIVFPIIHGNTCEDGKLQALFELNNTKYVGSNSYSSLICYDKMITKLILEKYNIPQIPYYIYKKNSNFNDIQFPVVVKPCKCGSSIGINIAKNIDELKFALNEALKFDKKIIIEKYIENKRELECAILQKDDDLIISDIGEIVNNSSLYSYDSKYKNSAKTIISNIEKDIKDSIKDYSKKIFDILDCKGLARIDFIYDINTKELYFNEINTIPGFTEISMYPKLIINYGINSKNIISTLLSL